MQMARFIPHPARCLGIIYLLVFGVYAAAAGPIFDLPVSARFPLVPYPDADHRLQAMSDYGLEPAPADSVQTARATEAIRRIEWALRQRRPELMANKSALEFEIIEEEDVFGAKAIVTTVASNGPRSGLIVIPRGLLAPDVESDVRLGVLAHEAAHVVLNHDGFRPQVTAVWMAEHPERAAPIEAQVHLMEYQKLAEFAGGYPQIEFAGIPTPDSKLGEILERLTAGCGLPSLRTVQMLNAEAFSFFEWDYVFTSTKLSRDVALRQRDYQTRAARCRYSGTPLRDFSISADLIRRYLDPTFVWRNQNEIEVLFNLNASLHRRMREIADYGGFREIRWRSPEDEADDLAGEILTELRANPLAYLQAALDVYGTIRQPLRELCDLALRDGQPVPFGAPASAHHSPCYRLSRVQP